MCNHYRIERPDAVIAYARRWADTVEADSWQITANAWPKASMPIIYQADQRVLGAMRWGVKPWYQATTGSPRLVTNARDDALLVKAIWKSSAARRRCLVPADGFCEPTGPKGAMWEVLFRFKDRRPFFFAGLWSEDSVDKTRGFALVTGKPNELVEALPHNRMPVLLDEAGASAWLGSAPLPDGELLGLCAPYPATDMERFDLPKRKVQMTDELQFE